MAREEQEDRLLLDEIAAGQEQRFDRFVDRYKGRLIGYIRVRVVDRQWTEDLAQEVFLRVFRAAREGMHTRRPGSLRAWIFTIASHCVTDYQRHRLRRPLYLEGDRADETTDGVATPLDAAPSLDPDPLHSASWSEKQASVEALLRRLPELQCRVVRLRVYGNLTFVEIAEVEGCTEATAKSRMRYGLGKLERMLAKQSREKRR